MVLLFFVILFVEWRVIVRIELDRIWKFFRFVFRVWLVFRKVSYYCYVRNVFLIVYLEKFIRVFF